MRERLYVAGRYILLSTAALWIIGFTAVNVLTSVDAKIRTGAWVFLIGSSLSIFAAALTIFGRGNQRWLALIALIELLFWFGFTLY
ncbi:MAG TPA: hypothetical protein VFS41_08420 [Edaphobacter sp.]|nr:hypothetical protein [Edaphobacter sp.]